MKVFIGYEVVVIPETGHRVLQAKFKEIMKDKLELQKQYIEVKKKYDELSEKYWSFDSQIRLRSLSETQRFHEEKRQLEQEIKDTFTLLKSLNKQIYYER